MEHNDQRTPSERALDVIKPRVLESVMAELRNRVLDKPGARN